MADSEDDDPFNVIERNIRNAITKLQKHVAKMEDSPAYWAAMILHPTHKTRWIELNFSVQRAQSIIASFEKLFQEDYTTPPDPVAVAAPRPF